MPRRPRPIPAKPVYAGKPAQGRIKLLVRSQSSGIISAARGDVFFHKADVIGSYWDMQEGDRVVFELLDDAISGPRGQRVRLARSQKRR